MRHDATPGTLSPKQRRAVEALLSTGEVAAAAREAGINRASLHRWLKEPVFLQAVREAEAAALDELSRLLVRLGRTAAATLAKAMSDPATPWSTRVRAADASLGRLLQLRELATLEARVTELERFSGLEELSELAQKADEANRTGQPVTWTAEELVVLDRIGAKHAAQQRW